jgi:hypothetical protein
MSEYGVFRKEPYNLENLYKFIQRTSTFEMSQYR